MHRGAEPRMSVRNQGRGIKARPEGIATPGHVARMGPDRNQSRGSDRDHGYQDEQQREQRSERQRTRVAERQLKEHRQEMKEVREEMESKVADLTERNAMLQAAVQATEILAENAIAKMVNSRDEAKRAWAAAKWCQDRLLNGPPPDSPESTD